MEHSNEDNCAICAGFGVVDTVDSETGLGVQRPCKCTLCWAKEVYSVLGLKNKLSENGRNELDHDSTET